MKYSIAGTGMILLGLIGFVVVWVFQFLTINNESDYYSLKEAMEASMLESIDWVYYRNSYNDNNKAEIKIIEEKFVANFTKRFLKNTIGSSNGYVLEFYDIMEKPPKATVKVINKSISMGLTKDSFDVVNELTGILEANIAESYTNTGCGDENLRIGQISNKYYSFIKIKGGEEASYYYKLKLPLDVSNENVRKYWIDSIVFSKTLSSLDNDKYNEFVNNNLYANSQNGVNFKILSGVNAEKDLDATCSSKYNIVPDFSANIISASGEEDGYPIINVRTLSNNLEKSVYCSVLFEYVVTWKYSYCVGGG